MLRSRRQELIGEPPNCRHARRVGSLVDEGDPALVGFHDRLIVGNNPGHAYFMARGKLAHRLLVTRSADLVRDHGDTSDAEVFGEGEGAPHRLERLEIRLGDEKEVVHVSRRAPAQVFESGLQVHDGRP